MKIAVMVLAITLLALGCLFEPVIAHDHNREYLNGWFSGLHAGKDGKGAWCCDGSDLDTGKAKHVATEDWDVKDGHYRVRLDGQWIDVPDDAVIHQPNLYGETLVWPVYVSGLSISIRCFLPGPMT